MPDLTDLMSIGWDSARPGFSALLDHLQLTRAVSSARGTNTRVSDPAAAHEARRATPSLAMRERLFAPSREPFRASDPTAHPRAARSSLTASSSPAPAQTSVARILESQQPEQHVIGVRDAERSSMCEPLAERRAKEDQRADAKHACLRRTRSARASKVKLAVVITNDIKPCLHPTDRSHLRIGMVLQG